MVRTSRGIRISAGKSSKKTSSGGSGGGGSHATPTSSGKSSGSTRLPPIPHCEAPAWQKPITNFFTCNPGPSEEGVQEKIVMNIDQNEEREERSGKKELSPNVQASEKSKDLLENDIKNTETGNDEQPSEKKRKMEDRGKENIDNNLE